MKRSVGLILLTKINGQLTAVLHARGTFNVQTLKPESWPGVTQVTCHGRLKDGEEWTAALYREASEELGKYMEEVVRHHADDLKLVHHQTQGAEEVQTFALYLLNPAFLKFFRLPGDTGGLRYAVPGDKRLCDVQAKGCTKENGVVDVNVLAMFPDELAAVQKAFELFATAP
jgi:hypothetical protein